MVLHFRISLSTRTLHWDYSVKNQIPKNGSKVGCRVALNWTSLKVIVVQLLAANIFTWRALTEETHVVSFAKKILDGASSKMPAILEYATQPLQSTIENRDQLSLPLQSATHDLALNYAAISDPTQWAHMNGGFVLTGMCPSHSCERKWSIPESDLSNYIWLVWHPIMLNGSVTWSFAIKRIRSALYYSDNNTFKCWWKRRDLVAVVKEASSPAPSSSKCLQSRIIHWWGWKKNAAVSTVHVSNVDFWKSLYLKSFRCFLSGSFHYRTSPRLLQNQ